MRNVLSLRCALVLMLNASILLSSNSAIAAEQVVLNYRSFSVNFVEELSNFAETGELSTSLQLNLALAQEPNSPVFDAASFGECPLLDRVLNSDWQFCTR